ncbi:hypothetical protein [Gordonia terrae]
MPDVSAGYDPADHCAGYDPAGPHHYAKRRALWVPGTDDTPDGPAVRGGAEQATLDGPVGFR